jgi:intracellular sulfur oxidation DsrE/DsrF family protein
MGLFAMAMVLATGVAAFAENVHRLALQISDDDPAKMTAVLNVAANTSVYYSGIGEEIEIRIVAFNAGLHMLRADTSSVKDRLTGFTQSMPNVSFVACGNTIASMQKKEGKDIPLVEGVETVPAGVVELMTLNEQGWTILRP